MLGPPADRSCSRGAALLGMNPILFSDSLPAQENPANNAKKRTDSPVTFGGETQAGKEHVSMIP